MDSLLFSDQHPDLSSADAQTRSDFQCTVVRDHDFAGRGWVAANPSMQASDAIAPSVAGLDRGALKLPLFASSGIARPRFRGPALLHRRHKTQIAPARPIE